MSAFHRLLETTSEARREFQAIPVVIEACERGVPRAAYLDFLGQAYHHVRHTCPLLARAASRCGPGDDDYRDALFDYIAEERGHERWILDDIAALGGDAAAVRDGQPRLPCRLMVAYAWYAIDHVSPYALLGMVHVLEGMSVLLATRAAATVAGGLGLMAGSPGFSYLASHGSLDAGHVAFFADLFDRVATPARLDTIVETAATIYRLYGDIFRDVAARHEVRSDAA